MAVPQQQPYITYAANGIATTFAIPFKLILASDLAVQLDGDLVTSGYTVTGLGNDTASITFGTAPSGTLLLLRDVPLERQTDYQELGDLLARTVNLDFDRLWMVLQGFGSRLLSVLRAPFPEVLPELPAAADRADKILSFDADGNPVVTVPAVTGAEGLGLALANQTNSALGANLIGFMGQTLVSRLLKIRYASDYPNAQAAIDSGANLLLWPAGENVVTSVTPRSFQVWQGVHRDASIMRWAPVNVPTFGYSMIQSDDDIQGFHIRSMTFVGNRQYQTSSSTDNQDMGCLHLRGGSVIDVSVEDFVIRDFGMLNLKGDGTTSGHGALIGSRTGTGKKIKNVKFRHGVFRDISNVPGVYVNGESTFHDEMDGVVVDDVDFYVDIATAIQNCVYILGDATNVAKGVKVGDVRFHLSKPIDCAIELNWCQGFEIGTYSVTATDTGICTPVLIRDGSESGSIGKGYLRKTGTGGDNAAGVSIVKFSGGSGQQKRLFVDTVHAYNWGTGANGTVVNISGGSSSITVNSAYIESRATPFARIETGVTIGDECTDITLLEINQENVKYPYRYAGRAYGVTIEGGTLTACGVVGESLIVSNSGGYAIQQNMIKGVRVFSSGAAHLVGLVSTSSLRNRVLDNDIPSTMVDVNPSYLTSQETIRKLGAGNGKGLLGTQYTFAQGILSITNNTSFLIGGNLDAQGPVCKPGDLVIASYVGDALGASISIGYVPVSGQVRFRVGNNTGATINIPAGNWNVLIIPN